jgi:hypothetical protein
MQACAAGSVAPLSIYDRTEGRQLQVYWHEGRAYAFERASLVPAETITIYYSSRANLVARGVIREPVPWRLCRGRFPGSLPILPDSPG